MLGLDAGLRARGERSLGSDFSDVKVIVGDGVADTRQAAATTEGRTIHVNPAVLGPDGRVPDDLIAHELTHVAQGDVDGSGGDPEQEARDNVDAVLGGRPVDIEAPATGAHDETLAEYGDLETSADQNDDSPWSPMIGDYSFSSLFGPAPAMTGSTPATEQDSDSFGWTEPGWMDVSGWIPSASDARSGFDDPAAPTDPLSNQTKTSITAKDGALAASRTTTSGYAAAGYEAKDTSGVAFDKGGLGFTTGSSRSIQEPDTLNPQLADSHAFRAGLVGKDGFAGVGTSAEASHTTGDTTIGVKGARQLTTNGYARTGEASASQNLGAAAVSGKVLTSSGLHATVEACPGDAASGILVVTLDGSAGINGGIGSEGKAAGSRYTAKVPGEEPEGQAPLDKGDTASGSAEFGAALKGHLSLRKKLPKKQADEIAATLKDPASNHAAILRSLGTIGDTLASVDNVAALASPTVAASMKDGEAVELELGGEVSGGVKAGAGSKSLDDLAGSVGASASLKAEASRKLLISRELVDGVSAVVVTVTFKAATSETLGANGALGMAGMALSSGASSGAEDSYTFQLYPNESGYADQYDEIATAATPGALELLTPLYGKRASTARKRAEADAFGVKASVGVAAVNIGTKQDHSESCTDGPDGQICAIDGSTKETAALSLAGVEVGSQSSAQAGSAKFDKNGGAVDITDTETSTDYGWQGLSSLGDYLTKGPQGVMDTFKKDQAHVEAWNLDDADLETLGRRSAEHPDAWGAIGLSALGFEYARWTRLGFDLRAGVPDAALLQQGADRALAVRATRYRAIVVLMEQCGAGARDAFDAVLTHWEDYVRAETGDQEPTIEVGSHNEWPPELDSTKRDWETLVKEWTAVDIDAAIDASAGEGDKYEVLAARVDDLAVRLDTIEAAVKTGAGAFHSADAGAHMLEKFGTMRAELAGWRVKLRECAGLAKDVSCAKIDGVRPPDADAEVERLERLVGSMKPFETAMFTRMEAAMPSDTELIPGLLSWPSGDLRGFHAFLDQVELQYERTWVPSILDLRLAYEDALVPVDDWLVSLKGSERDAEREPDTDRYWTLTEQAHAPNKDVRALLAKY